MKTLGELEERERSCPASFKPREPWDALGCSFSCVDGLGAPGLSGTFAVTDSRIKFPK
jgi:hypothetical protein